MKITTFNINTPLGKIKRLGIFFNESTIIDINNTWATEYERLGYYSPESKANYFYPSSLSKFLNLYQEEALEKLKETVELFIRLRKDGIIYNKNKTPYSFNLFDDKEISLAKPLDHINMYRDFYIHERHVKTGFAKRNEEIPAPWFEMPVYYKGAKDNFIGPDETILWPNYTKILDYELELGAIISKDGINVKEKEVHKHIFGFTILNDISARDIQKKEMQVRLGPSKGKDFCSIIGPVIVTADELGGEPDLLMTASINDELWSQGRSSEAKYSWAEMISFASKEEWIRSTDFMGSGTVGSGCGLELDKWIKPGDLLTLEIEKIGKLKNIVGTPHL